MAFCLMNFLNQKKPKIMLLEHVKHLSPRSIPHHVLPGRVRTLLGLEDAQTNSRGEQGGRDGSKSSQLSESHSEGDQGTGESGLTPLGRSCQAPHPSPSKITGRFTLRSAHAFTSLLSPPFIRRYFLVPQ